MADSRIATVLAADDRFSRPMAATVRSIVAQLSPGRGLDLYLCDMGITPQNREKIAAAAAHPEARLHWVETLKEKVEHLSLLQALTECQHKLLAIMRELKDLLHHVVHYPDVFFRIVRTDLDVVRAAAALEEMIPLRPVL